MKRLTILATIFLALAICLGCGPATDNPDETSGETNAARDKQGWNETANGGAMSTDLREAEPSADDAIPAAVEPSGAPTTEEELRAALTAKNPKFSGQLQASVGPEGIMAVLINDPGIEDISPLAGLSLLAADLQGCHITDVSPLEGMPMRELFLEKTGVRDISPMRGMPLEKLYMSETPVDDVSALEGAPLVELNLAYTRVADVSPLAKSRLKMVWLNDAPVVDISGLAPNPLESITLAGTKVHDLSPLKGHPTLRRLHIARSEVTDLTPLEWMEGLTRLVFTPNRIEKGMAAARAMRSLQEIGTSFGEKDQGRADDMNPPAVFWRRYDAGEFN